MNWLKILQRLASSPTLPMASKPDHCIIRIDLAKLRALVYNRQLGSTSIIWNDIDEKKGTYKEDEYDFTLDQHNELVARVKAYGKKVQDAKTTPTPLGTECHVFLDDSEL